LTLGCIAAVYGQPEPATSTGALARTAQHPFAPAKCGRIAPKEIAAWSATRLRQRQNLWRRWSKLVANAMGNGLSACTGLPGGDMLQSEPIRRFSTRLGSEAIRVGQAHGYQLEEILHLPPETIARAGEGDETATRVCDEQRFKDGKRTSSEQRPSMGQDMQKGRRTEIEFLNGFVVREGEKVGLSCTANAVLTDIVKRVERNELSPDPRHITELRLN
jgi:2-dehydropantoate 2-reductase